MIALCCQRCSVVVALQGDRHTGCHDNCTAPCKDGGVQTGISFQRMAMVGPLPKREAGRDAAGEVGRGTPTGERHDEGTYARNYPLPERHGWG